MYVTLTVKRICFVFNRMKWSSESRLECNGLNASSLTKLTYHIYAGTGIAEASHVNANPRYPNMGVGKHVHPNRGLSRNMKCDVFQLLQHYSAHNIYVS